MKHGNCTYFLGCGLQIQVSKHELDLIFTVFDTTGDGSIDRDEFGRIVSEAAGAPRSGARR